jgi:hypothetical protein
LSAMGSKKWVYFYKVEFKYQLRKTRTMKRISKALFIIGLVIAAFLLIAVVITFVLFFPMIKLAHMEKGG